MLMVSSETGSRPLGVILTVRREVFIWGETEVMVPWRIVPIVIFELENSGRLLFGEMMALEALRLMLGIGWGYSPFFSSTVTVSLAHFIKNLSNSFNVSKRTVMVVHARWELVIVAHRRL
jgi:hypothetical protein